MAHDPSKYYDNLSACSLCLSCSNVCPAKVDLGEQIYRWRQTLKDIDKASTEKQFMSAGMKFLMERTVLFNAALWAAPMVNVMPDAIKYNRLNEWGKGRELPKFAGESFNSMWKKGKVQRKEIKATVYPDKISRFYEISQFVGGKAVVLQEAEDINDIIRSHFPEARKIASQMEEITCATIRPDTLAEAQELDGTDVAVVEGAFGVAENGAVWIPQNVKHKALYFIAEALVIVLDRHSLVHNMQEAYEFLAGQTYPFGTFISGPSKTADIEQALVMGAHGACTCLVILK